MKCNNPSGDCYWEGGQPKACSSCCDSLLARYVHMLGLVQEREDGRKPSGIAAAGTRKSMIVLSGLRMKDETARNSDIGKTLALKYFRIS